MSEVELAEMKPQRRCALNYSRRLEHAVSWLLEGHKETLVEVNNYATDLCELRRFDEAKSLLRKAIPVARRSLGDRNENTLRLRWNYARALYLDDEVTPDGLREAVTRLEELAPYARRILGGTHPGTTVIELTLRDAQAALRAAEQS